MTCIDERSKDGKEELLTVSSAYGVIPRNSAKVTMFKAKSYAGYKLCWPGDLAINSLWAWGGGLGVSRHHGIISTAYSVYRARPSAQIHPRFLHELVRSSAFNWELQVRSKGIWISRLQLTDQSFLDAPIPLPPPDEQSAIVRFLDHWNGRLEKAIRAKRRVIALLQEQKQAIIHRAVTRGLDPNVKLKDSGIPWLGEIPAHWEIISVRAASHLIQTGPFGSQIHQHEYEPGGVPLINPSHMKDGRISSDSRAAVSELKFFELVRHSLRQGDVVAARRGEMGRSAIVTDRESGFLCGTGSLLIRLKASYFNSLYFQQVFSSSGVSGLLRADSIGSTMDNLNAGMVGRLRFPLPPLDEQEQIIDAIAVDTNRLTTAIARYEREITLLREYRARLTADVVTGKLDVRAAAAQLPEEAEEETLPDPEISEEETELEEVE